MLQNCLFAYSFAKYSCFNKWSFFPSIFQSTAVLTSGHSFPSIFQSLLFSSTDFRFPYLVLYPCAWELQEVQWIISSNTVGRLSKYRFPFFSQDTSWVKYSNFQREIYSSVKLVPAAFHVLIWDVYRIWDPYCDHCIYGKFVGCNQHQLCNF